MGAFGFVIGSVCPTSLLPTGNTSSIIHILQWYFYIRDTLDRRAYSKFLKNGEKRYHKDEFCGYSFWHEPGWNGIYCSSLWY